MCMYPRTRVPVSLFEFSLPACSPRGESSGRRGESTFHSGRSSPAILARARGMTRSVRVPVCVRVRACVGIDTLIRRELSYLCHFKILSGSLSIEYRPLSPRFNASVHVTTIPWITIDARPSVSAPPSRPSIDRPTLSRAFFVLAKPYLLFTDLYMHVYMLYIIYIIYIIHIYLVYTIYQFCMYILCI